MQRELDRKMALRTERLTQMREASGKRVGVEDERLQLTANIYWALKYTRHSFNPPFNRIRRILILQRRSLKNREVKRITWLTTRAEVHTFNRHSTSLDLTEIFRGFRIKWLKEYGAISGNRVFRDVGSQN